MSRHYVFKGAIFTPGPLIEELIRIGEASPGGRGMDVEEVLVQIAGANVIDRATVSSDEFPRAI